MPTSFSVISLGIQAAIDNYDGDNIAENASVLVGLTFGGPGDALVDDFVQMSAVGSPGAEYNKGEYDEGELDDVGDQFSIDGGAAQAFHSVATYNATITYTDGSTASYSAVLFQDTDGNTYLVPEASANSDQTLLEAGPIRSISLDSLAGNNYSGMTADRQAWNFVTCFTRGTRIETGAGPVKIESLRIGDLIETADHGLQTLRWIGHSRARAQGGSAPVMIRKGALGNSDDLLVSPQHRILLSDWRIELYTGTPEALAAARHLVNGDTIRICPGGYVEYFHLMFDRHELVTAAGILSESFHPGSLAMGTLDNDDREKILDLFPALRSEGLAAYGSTARPCLKSHEARLLARDGVQGLRAKTRPNLRQLRRRRLNAAA